MRDASKELVEEKRHRRIGEFIDALSQGQGTTDLEGGALRGFTVRMATEEEPSVLIVVRADEGEGKVVAFVGAYSLGDALLAWRAKQAGPGMKWREDVPWAERGG